MENRTSGFLNPGGLTSGVINYGVLTSGVQNICRSYFLSPYLGCPTSFGTYYREESLLSKILGRLRVRNFFGLILPNVCGLRLIPVALDARINLSRSICRDRLLPPSFRRFSP